MLCEKKCSKCKKLVPVERFVKSAYVEDGYYSWCKDCCRVAQQVRKTKRPYYYWSIATLSNYRQAGYEVLIENTELEEKACQARFCDICGCELDWMPDKGVTKPMSPSLDRIHNGAMVCMENTQIICHLCNVTKGPRSMDEFIEYCKLVIRRN